jgi:hypothetical protein
LKSRIASGKKPRRKLASFLGIPVQGLNNVEMGTTLPIAFLIQAKTGVTTGWLWFDDVRGLSAVLAQELWRAAEKAKMQGSSD